MDLLRLDLRTVAEMLGT